jgi:general secretion pathway protein G
MMPMSKRGRLQRGFSLIELAVVAVIVGLLATALLNRIVFYQEQAEKTAMEQNLGIMRSALHLQISDLLVHGNMVGINRLVDQDPMSWLAEKPSNFAGEFYTPQPGIIAAGNWYFEMRTKNLIYLANNTEHLHTAPGESNKLRFKLQLVYNTSDASAPKNAANSNDDVVAGVILVPVIPYKWF